VIGDGDRLRQVVDNLLTNALVHTPEATPVDVRLSTETATACLEVSDHGPGILPEERPHIFEPFHRADPTRARATGGVGLGLSIVSAIAHAHGGTVGVVSNPAETDSPSGATFWVRIPLAGAAPRPVPSDETVRRERARPDDTAPPDETELQSTTPADSVIAETAEH
jgi:two-component system OmpR family sensor kinase